MNNPKNSILYKIFKDKEFKEENFKELFRKYNPNFNKKIRPYNKDQFLFEENEQLKEMSK